MTEARSTVLLGRNRVNPIVRFFRILWKQRTLVALCVLPMTLLFVFSYGPMYGVLIAFKRYSPALGVWNSAWVGFNNLTEFFSNVNCFKIIMQTLKVGIFSLVFTYPMPIILRSRLTKWAPRLSSAPYSP